jgi:hypothetical protein
MTYLVTAATGNIGSATMRALLERTESGASRQPPVDDVPVEGAAPRCHMTRTRPRSALGEPAQRLGRSRLLRGRALASPRPLWTRRGSLLVTLKQRKAPPEQGFRVHRGDRI